MATLDKDILAPKEGVTGAFSSIIPLLVIAVTSGAILQSSIQGIFGRWLKFDEAYSHGLLVLAITFYLLFRSLRATWPLKVVPNYLGFVALVGTSFVWALSQALSIQVIEEFLVPVLLWLPFFSIYGWRQARLLIVPIGFLYFAIPFWDYLSMPLQLITVAVNEVGFSITGISAEIEGVFVHLPGIGTFEVAHGCSGLRYLVVGLTLTTLFGYLNYDRWSLRFILIGLGLLLSLTANWIRVFIIIYAGYKTNMESSLIEDHDMFGWWVFAGTLVPLFWVANVLARKSEEPKIAKPVISPESQTPIKQMWSLVAFAAVMIIPAGFIKLQTQDALEYYAPIELPQQFGEWKPLRVAVSSPWSPVMRGYTQNIQVRYFNPVNQSLTVSVYLYSVQAPGSELVQDANRLYDHREWKVIDSDHHLLFNGLMYNHFILEERTSARRVAVMQGYHVAGFSYSDRVKAKLLQFIGYINGRHDAAEIFVSAECKSECSSETEKLRDFVTNFGREIVDATEKAYFLSIDALGN